MKVVNAAQFLFTERNVDWGNGNSIRMTVKDDGMAFSVNQTVVYRGTSSKLKYDNHHECCYVLSGHGAVEHEGKLHTIGPGDMYVLNGNEAHRLIANEQQDLVILCIFSPALSGLETHNLSGEYSGYDKA